MHCNGLAKMLRLLRFRPGCAAGLPKYITLNIAAAVFVRRLTAHTFGNFPIMSAAIYTRHMLPLRSHIVRKLAGTFIGFAYRLATKRRLALPGFPGRIDY